MKLTELLLPLVLCPFLFMEGTPRLMILCFSVSVFSLTTTGCRRCPLLLMWKFLPVKKGVIPLHHPHKPAQDHTVHLQKLMNE